MESKIRRINHARPRFCGVVLLFRGGAEGDIEHELGDGYEVKFCPFCGSELKIDDEFDIQEELDFDE